MKSVLGFVDGFLDGLPVRMAERLMKPTPIWTPSIKILPIRRDKQLGVMVMVYWVLPGSHAPPCKSF